MNSEVIRETYSELNRLLNDTGFGWVVQQVEQTIQAGHPVERETRLFREEQRSRREREYREANEGQRRPGKAAVMMAVEPWAESEQLLFLIDAIRHAVVYAARIETEQLKLLQSIGQVQSVRFESEENNIEGKAFILTSESGLRIEELAKLLDALEEEVRK
jgi:hypothetical protein